MILYIYENFSNYYNKRVERYNTVAEYGTYAFTQANVNFNPNDGVTTTIILGSTSRYEGNGDYLLAVEDGQIVSRWYIMEQERDRAGQYTVTLRRDLIADFYDAFMSSTTFLEKGWITDTSNFLLFNDEKYNANQIKKNETPLMGKDKCMWLIGYVDKPGKIVSEGGETIPNTFWNGTEMRTNITGNINYDEEVASWDSWDLWPFVSGDLKVVNNIILTYYTKFVGNANVYSYSQNRDGFLSYKTEDSNTPAGMSLTYNRNSYNDYIKDTWTKRYIENYGDIEPHLVSLLGADISNSQYERLLALNGKIVHAVSHNVGQPEYIQITANAAATLPSWYAGSGYKDITASSAPTAYQKLKQISGSDPSLVYINDNVRTFTGFTTYNRIITSYKTISSLGIENYKWQTDDSGHAHVINEAYDAFAIPISTNSSYDVRIIDHEGNIGHIAANREAGFITAQSLIQQAGSGGYDLQLTPFGPIEDGRISVSGNAISFDCSTLSPKFDYSIVYTEGNIARTTIFWITKNSVSHTLDYSIANETTPEAIKSANQLDIWRLSSGDYSSQFEFSPVRNRGVSSFIADITFKPFAPWLRVAPFFNTDGLYGGEWGDTRGLVCSNTNFSLSRANNAWETYERNNLNYQNAFKRQLDTMDQLHSYERTEGIINAITGAVGSGTAIGAMASGTGKLGPGLGIAAGIASGAAGAADIYFNEQRFTLNRDNAIAQHHEDLANIKAMPNTLATGGANTINNKVFPLLVYYSCSPAEKTAFTDTLHYYGMTINRLTTNIAEYLNPQRDETYIKGRLIRIDLAEDNHLAYEIAQELAGGVYIVNTEQEDEE